MSAPINPPFVFGIKVSGETFTDRVNETKRLKKNFEAGLNTILISPRRMGKTSLVDKVSTLVTSDDIKVARFDAFSCRNEADFVNALATSVIKATSSQWEDWMQNVKIFLSRFVPKINIGSDPMTEFSISFELDTRPELLEDILELPATIAQKKGIRLVVCIDEFQQIGEFENSLTFQKKLRGVWQHHENVCYCLYGSKKSMMEKMFQNHSNPFYRFGDIFYLNKIPREDWIPFIIERFEQTGKTISSELAGKVADLTQCYSAYVQQLAWFLWVQTDKVATQADLDYAVNQLLDSCEPLFIVQTEKLTRMQLNFLRALTDGITNGFSHQEILNKYGFRSSANISRIKEALIDKDLIVPTGIGQIELSDPILGLWLKKRVWAS